MEFSRGRSSRRSPGERFRSRGTAPFHPLKRGFDEFFGFLAGANSIFYGDQLLTTGNPEVERDRNLLDKLGMYPFAEKR